MQIDIIDENEYLSEKNHDLLLRILTHTLHEEKVPKHAELSVSIVTNDEIKQLNKTYRNIDKETDVLSFPMIDFSEENIAEVNESEYLLLGDIVISYDRAVEQANEYGHSFERELAFLAVHGLLHLLGYTHDEETDEKEMFSKQEQILQVFHLER